MKVNCSANNIAVHHSSAPQQCTMSVHHSSAPQQCTIAVHHSSAPQQYHSSAPQQCTTAVHHSSVVAVRHVSALLPLSNVNPSLAFLSRAESSVNTAQRHKLSLFAVHPISRSCLNRPLVKQPTHVQQTIKTFQFIMDLFPQLSNCIILSFFTKLNNFTVMLAILAVNTCIEGTLFGTSAGL